MTRWTYGDSWERYPIEPGQVWMERTTGSKLAVVDIFHSMPGYMHEADMVYTDTPWNTGNINTFYTKAGLEERHTFEELVQVLLSYLSYTNPRVCYLEIGRQNAHHYRGLLRLLYPIVQEWPITYYRKNPMLLLRGGEEPQHYDFTGDDDGVTPGLAMQVEEWTCVADPCMGRGLTACSAFALGKSFVGTELNKRRLAVTIDRVAKQGGAWTHD